MEQVNVVIPADGDFRKQESSVAQEVSVRGKRQMQRTKCEVWSRVVGYLRPTARWNNGKLEEFKDRAEFSC